MTPNTRNDNELAYAGKCIILQKIINVANYYYSFHELKKQTDIHHIQNISSPLYSVEHLWPIRILREIIIPCLDFSLWHSLGKAYVQLPHPITTSSAGILKSPPHYLARRQWAMERLGERGRSFEEREWELTLSPKCNANSIGWNRHWPRRTRGQRA